MATTVVILIMVTLGQRLGTQATATMMLRPVILVLDTISEPR